MDPIANPNLRAPERKVEWQNAGIAIPGGPVETATSEAFWVALHRMGNAHCSRRRKAVVLGHTLTSAATSGGPGCATRACAARVRVETIPRKQEVGR